MMCEKIRNDRKWCHVDTDNIFEFLGCRFEISNDVVDYRVYKNSKDFKEYTNESYMDKILCSIEYKGSYKILFYNQNEEEIDSKYIKIVGFNFGDDRNEVV